VLTTVKFDRFFRIAIEVAPSSAAIMLTVRYLDQNPGAGRPPTTVAHAARIGS